MNAKTVNGKEDSVLNNHLVKLDLIENELKTIESGLNSRPDDLYHNVKIDLKLEDAKRQLSDLLTLIAERRKMLKLQQDGLEFDREASELMQWINEKRAQAQSEDYGQDFEHLVLINAKFQALKDEVRTCEEPRIASVRKPSTHLLAAKSPEAKAIRNRIDDVKTARELLEEDMHNQELTLNSAAEIHCFNKDVQDLLRRISDKELAFTGVEKNLSRDVHSCEVF